MDQLSATETNSADDDGRLCRHVASDVVFADEILAAADGQKTYGRGDEFHLRQARRQFEQISVAAQAFTLQLDFQKLLMEIAAHGYGILRADQVVVYSHIDNQLCREVQFPTTDDKRGANDAPVTEDVAWCIRYLKAKVCNDAYPDDVNIRNTICVPLVASQNRVLAVVEFRNKRTGAIFTEQDARMATCLARVATIAVDRARLFFRIDEWKRSIETLLTFNATVNQQLEPAEMLRELVVNVTGFLNADGGVAGITIRNESGMTVQCDGFYFANLWYGYVRRWQSGEGLPGTMLDTEFPCLIKDYTTNALGDPFLSSKFDLGSCICVPIKNAQERVLGFFQLHRRVGQEEFTWQDAAFLESLGNTAAVAIENARLVKSLELKNAQVKTLSQDHVRQLEEERQHIARELHDETGQVLVGLKLRLKVLSGLLNEDQDDARSELAELRSQLINATVRLKDLARRLRPPTLDEFGFEAALRDLAAEYGRNSDLTIRLDIQSTPVLSGSAETALYRIVQECLTNVAKHAEATMVEISFRPAQGHHVLVIADDGIGFDTKAAANGLGHVGIKERMRMLNGRVDVQSSRGQGTTIEVTLSDSVTQSDTE